MLCRSTATLWLRARQTLRVLQLLRRLLQLLRLRIHLLQLCPGRQAMVAHLCLCGWHRTVRFTLALLRASSLPRCALAMARALGDWRAPSSLARL